MKWLVAILIFVWLICGLAGAWRLGELDADHWKVIARGPISLAKAFNENPVSIPTQD